MSTLGAIDAAYSREKKESEGEGKGDKEIWNERKGVNEIGESETRGWEMKSRR